MANEGKGNSGGSPRKASGSRPAKKAGGRKAPAKKPASGGSVSTGDLSPAMVKGGILIFIAVVIGLFLLNGPDSGDAAPDASGAGVEIDGDDPEADDETDDPDDPGVTTVPSISVETTTTIAARPPGEITVLVANASGIPGAASEVSDDVAVAGYGTSEPANATVALGEGDPTEIYYTGSDEADARSVATVLGLPESSVAPMPDPMPVTDLRGATVLVLLGRDLAPTSDG